MDYIEDEVRCGDAQCGMIGGAMEGGGQDIGEDKP
jgi:hypothetical protein